VVTLDTLRPPAVPWPVRPAAPDATDIPEPSTPSRYVGKLDDPWSSHARLLALAGEGADRRLLDVGSAQGELARRFTERGFHVTCVEADPALAEQARRNCEVLWPIDLDRDALPESAPFDVMVFGDVLEHLKDPLPVLRAALARLRPGGLVLVSVPNVAHLYVRLGLLFGRFEYADRGILDRTHLRFFTRASFRRFLRDAGLVVTRLVATPVPLPLVVPERFHGRVLRAVHRTSALLASAWKGGLAYQLVASCRTAEHA
jgi:2-polyprenyl-3-methyl-5-hydroxy-6-metoxy-1,4-benzoquinol methylase